MVDDDTNDESDLQSSSRLTAPNAEQMTGATPATSGELIDSAPDTKCAISLPKSDFLLPKFHVPVGEAEIAHWGYIKAKAQLYPVPVVRGEETEIYFCLPLAK